MNKFVACGMSLGVLVMFADCTALAGSDIAQANTASTIGVSVVRHDKDEADRSNSAARAKAIEDQLLGSIGSIGTDSPTKWRIDLREFAGAVARIAQKCTALTGTPSEIMYGRLGKEFRIFQDSSGQAIWVSVEQSTGNELHGCLAAELNGDILWEGTVKNVAILENERSCRVTVSIPSPSGMPSNVSMADTITVTYPAVVVIPGNTPTEGDVIRFAGLLKAPESRKTGEGVWVAYGVGPNRGQTKVLVDVVGYSLQKK